MDEFLLDYLEARVSPELKLETEIAFDTLNKFFEEDINQDFIDLLAHEDEEHKENIQAQFFLILSDKIEFVFKQHKLAFTDDARLSEKNQLMLALYRIQNLEDYMELVPILESNRSAEEMIADMFELYCELSAIKILSLIEKVDEELINLIRVMVEDKTKAGDDEGYGVSYDPNLIKTLKAFKANGGQDTLGIKLVDGQFPIGLKLERYIPFVQEHLHAETNIENLIRDVYSLILISEGGYEQPSMFFRERSHLFTTEASVVTKLDVGILKLTSELTKLVQLGETNEQS